MKSVDQFILRKWARFVSRVLKLIPTKKRFESSVLIADYPSKCDRAWQLLGDTEFQRAITEANQLIQSNDPEIRLGGLRARVVAQIRLQQYDGAFNDASEVVRLDDRWFTDWFNLCLASPGAGQIEAGCKAYEQAHQIRTSIQTDNRPSPLDTKYYFSRALIDAGEFDLGLKYLAELGEVYKELKIMDTTFLWIRGVPLFHDFCSGVLLGCQNDVQIAREWMHSIYENVDECGQQMIQEIIG